MAGDPWILRGLLQGGGRDGMGRLPLQQGPRHGVEPEEDRQQAGPRPGQADDDPRSLYPPLPDLGVLFGPALELNAVGQRAGQHFGDEEAPEGRQLGLLLAGAEVHLERFPVGVAAEVVRPRLLTAAAITDDGLREGSSGPKRATWRPSS